MADPHVISTLRSKIAEIERTIVNYEAALKKARDDLTALGLTLKVFEQGETGAPDCFSPTMSVSKLFKRGEVFAIVREALTGSPDGLDTRELALLCLRARGYDETNAVLRKAMAKCLVDVMNKRRLRRDVGRVGRRKGVIVWGLATRSPAPLAVSRPVP